MCPVMISSLRSQYFLHGNVKTTYRSSGDCCVDGVLGSEGTQTHTVTASHQTEPNANCATRCLSFMCFQCHQLMISPAPPHHNSILAYQQPNAKKLRRIAQKAEQLAAKGVVPQKKKQLLSRRPVERTVKKAITEANNNPNREYYDIWGQECKFSVCLCLYMCVQ